MTWEGILPYLNFFSRWALFLAVAYKAYREREKSWALLAFAFFINALDIEKYLLTPLGLTVNREAYDVASKVSNFFVAVLAVWGALHLKYSTSKLRHTLYLGTFAVASYVWLFLLATDFFGDSFALKASFPSLAFGGALIYVGYILRGYVIERRSLQELLPWGLILLGALNLTYPVGRPIEWYSEFAFSLAAVARLMAALGALQFVLLPSPPLQQSISSVDMGTFLFTNEEAFKRKFPDEFRKGHTVVLTRKGPDWINSNVGRYGVAFWLTRVKEGRIGDNIIAISPTKIDILVDLVEKELERGFRVVYLDAFEYLMVEDGFDVAVKFLLSLKDRVLAHEGRFVVVMSMDALDEKQRAIIKREFEVVEEA
ncbi:DUF835 domain-containing protein [Palaeococcus ferrophilus]|uniref:DUF835 domain-containing protein n=1 Tax=Palaeococcus ferrophilus TaxID=83868 RepID=UPI00064F1A08|nr:DUF835 domain-containing protein [Palaeococcus ferrophilus]